MKAIRLEVVVQQVFVGKAALAHADDFELVRAMNRNRHKAAGGLVRTADLDPSISVDGAHEIDVAEVSLGVAHATAPSVSAFALVWRSGFMATRRSAVSRMFLPAATCSIFGQYQAATELRRHMPCADTYGTPISSANGPMPPQ